MPSYVVDCVCGCGSFEAGSQRAKWATPGCKKRAQRAAEAVVEEPSGSADGAPVKGLKPEDPLVTATRRDLVKAGQLDTVDGQIAMHLAGQVKAATGSQASSLARELRVVLDRVLPKAPQSDEPSPTEPEEDEVARARRQREEARKAAGLS